MGTGSKADADPNLKNGDYRWRNFPQGMNQDWDFYVELRCLRSNQDYIGACSRSRANSSPNPEKVI